MADLSPVAIEQFANEFTIANQQKGSKLEGCVMTQPVVGESTRFDVVGASTSTSNRPLNAVIEFDQDNPFTSPLAEMTPFESFRLIRKLQEFETKASARAPFAKSAAMQLGRDMDKSILSAMKASNTSAGSAAAMNFAMCAGVAELTEQNNWNTTDMTWVISPRVYNKLLQVDEYKRVDYINDKPLVGGEVKPFMGFRIIVSSLLTAAPFIVSANVHRTYAFSNEGVGLGIGQAISSVVEWRSDHRAWQCGADGAWGAVTIQPTSVLEVQVNGL
jgi:Phage capsid protein